MAHLETFNQWQSAERQATESERELFRASMAYARGEGPAPDPSLVEQARQRRERAHALFTQAMEEMRRTAESLRPPPRAPRGTVGDSASHA